MLGLSFVFSSFEPLLKSVSGASTLKVSEPLHPLMATIL
ncbi:hypothetical protein SCH4B_0490 [Ruegeria sp. TrichCH4B]|nr:hypothetical protein SCH4B_0490 [Ruegeria sp. TrichCH4B]